MSGQEMEIRFELKDSVEVLCRAIHAMKVFVEQTDEIIDGIERNNGEPFTAEQRILIGRTITFVVEQIIMTMNGISYDDEDSDENDEN